MCGIAGWVDWGSVPSDPQALQRMNDAIAHRGPDGEGIFFASTRDGVEKSEDGGKTWTPVTEYPLLAAFPLRLLIDPRAPATFYLVCWMRQSLRLVPSNSAANALADGVRQAAPRNLAGNVGALGRGQSIEGQYRSVAFPE